MNYSKIYYNDIANGLGFRTSLFVSGCNNHCKGCFNKETWDFNYGSPYTKEVQDHILESVAEPQIDGISILGGEPMDLKNTKTICNLIKEFRLKFNNKKNIWLYSGYTFEELKNRNDLYTNEIIQNIDILVDGRFIEELKDISLKFRGSTNQRVIDVKESLKQNSVVLYKD